MLTELPKLEDLSKDDILEEGLATPYPVHPFYILEQSSAVCFFEPVLSVQKMSVIGLEAVRRAVDPANPRRLFDPGDFFRNMTAEDSHLKLPLDRLFQRKSFEAFVSLQAQASQLLMFLDVEPSILEESALASGHLLQQTGVFDLDPRRIVVQLSLAGWFDPLAAQRFVESQRDLGFLISLKDANNSPRHQDLLSRLNPDMVKVEDNLVRGLANNSQKRSDFFAFLKQAHSLGILVVAGGFESEEDALVALESGVDLVQGKYFSKSYKKNAVFTLNRKDRMQFLASRFKRRLQGKADRDRELKNRCSTVASALVACLPNKPVEEWPFDLPSLFESIPSLECLYLLNAAGVQATEAFCSQNHIPERKGILFHPSPKGTDHSFRGFYDALLSNPNQRWVLSESYLSMNSGNLCATLATVVGNPGGDFHILCADLNMAKV
ncbi:MAG TPA: EAL domain-containing protein [bacterium]|nr:EAL domain-containing protein [bacterium]